jgi:hypothetical protein
MPGKIHFPALAQYQARHTHLLAIRSLNFEKVTRPGQTTARRQDRFAPKFCAFPNKQSVHPIHPLKTLESNLRKETLCRMKGLLASQA